MDELSNAQLQWIDECGHVPHLEKPEETANVIVSFLTSTDVVTSTAKTSGKGTKTSSNRAEDSIPNYYIGGGVLSALLLEELIKQFF